MNDKLETNVDDAFNSMLRTDYIPLRDTAKLKRLARYYVDYFGYLRQIVGETDQLVVGRRGTGKTTLLYRALIECIQSWIPEAETKAKPRTLGIYLDLSKCQTLTDTANSDFLEFEHVFVSELIDSIREELIRNWPKVDREPTMVDWIFSPITTKQSTESAQALKNLAAIIRVGIPRNEEEAGPRKTRRKESESSSESGKFGGSFSEKGASVTGEIGSSATSQSEQETETLRSIRSRLTIADILRGLGELREACKMSHIVILIDEFSALSSDLQRRFSTLLRKLLGNHAGVYLKICAITDNFSLGSSIILQRDIFQLSLDLDSYVERSGSLNHAMDGLRDLTKDLVVQRINEYTNVAVSEIFEDPDETWIELSRSAMGVPRTVGIALKQAFHRCLQSGRKKIRVSDVEYGIKYATKAYLDQFLGACGIAIPSYAEEIWNALIERAIDERSKVDSSCSHFMLGGFKRPVQSVAAS